MSSTLVKAGQIAVFTVAASDKLATYSKSAYSVDDLVGYPNRPSVYDSKFSGSGLNTTAAYTNATTVRVTAGDDDVLYHAGTAPVIYEREFYQTTPGTLNATGTLTAALILGGIVTSTTAAAVTATLDTGAIMDAIGTFAVDDSFDWFVINTGGANAFTVTPAASGHTVVGAGAVAASTSGHFRTRKTAADTFVTYRL